MRVKGEMISWLAMLLSCRQNRSTSWLMRWSLEPTAQSNWTQGLGSGWRGYGSSMVPCLSETLAEEGPSQGLVSQRQ